MKITAIKIYKLRVPLRHSYALSNAYGVQNDTYNIVLEVFTDEGIVGWGECDPWPAFTGDTPESVIAIIKHTLAPVILGKDPRDIDSIREIMNKTLRGNNISKAGIEIACHDILGKSLGVPVHQLIGGNIKESIRCFWAVGGSTPEETASEIIAIKDAGFWGCMIKIGTDYKLDAARTLAAREAVGDDFPLISDANQGWDVNTAVLYGKAVESANLLFFEQPTPYWDVDGLAEVRRNVPMPVSADEGISTIYDARALVEKQACDYFSIKVSKHGGIRSAKEICKFAEERGIQLFFNSMLEQGITQAASLHIAATTPNILMSTGHSFFSTLRLQGDITDFEKWTNRGETLIPQKPGLGLEINLPILNKYTIGVDFISA